MIQIHGSLVVSCVDPDGRTNSAGASDATRLLTGSLYVVLHGLADAIDLLDKVPVLNVVLDHSELAETELGASKVNISRAITLS